MRKIYAFLAAALMSVSVFAAKDVVPSDATIMAACGGEVGQVVVGIFVPADMACFDVIFVGTYNNWGKGEGTMESAANCKKFEAIEGYDGWYAVAVDDESESPEGKPLMLDIDGNFNWAYQVGAATVIRGGVTVVAGGIAGEIDLKTYGKDAPNVFTVDAWKSNPCTAVYHNYNVQVISAGCDNLAVPFIIGGAAAVLGVTGVKKAIDVYNEEHADRQLEYRSGKAFNEGENIHYLTELVALSDQRARRFHE
jgi:hypothetical protein